MKAILDGQPKYVKIGEFEEIAASIIGYLNRPETGITPRVKVVAMAAESGAGSTETWYQITFTAERDAEWYPKMGILAKILMENVGYQFPRKVSLAIKYEHLLYPHFAIGLDVGCFSMRIGMPTEDKPLDRLDPEDLKTIR